MGGPAPCGGDGDERAAAVGNGFPSPPRREFFLLPTSRIDVESFEVMLGDRGRELREEQMPKTQIVSPKIRQLSGHFSQATMIEAKGRLVFISGMTARRADGTIAGIGDIEAQTRQVCESIKSAVEEAGGTMDDICRVDVYVRNMEHFDQIHKVRREYFRPPAPASTMVEVCKMTSPEYLIEINAIAVIGN